MNVCNEGGPIVVFRAPPESRSAVRTKTSTDATWMDQVRSRELAERAAAKSARCEAARRVHQELAQAYARMISRPERAK